MAARERVIDLVPPAKRPVVNDDGPGAKENDFVKRHGVHFHIGDKKWLSDPLDSFW